MTVSVSFVAKGLCASADQLRSALVRTATDHAILRYSVDSDNSVVSLKELGVSTLEFKENVFFKDVEFPTSMPTKDVVRTRLIDEARRPSDNTKSLFTLTAEKYTDGVVFFLVVNHGISDGTSIFSIVNSFCRNVELVLNGPNLAGDDAYFLANNQALIPRDLVQELLDNPVMHEEEDPALSEDYSNLLKFPKLNDENSDAAKNGCIRCIFLDVDCAGTSAILANCRRHRVSFQSLLAAAASLALYKLLSISGELDAEVWKAPVVHICPMNMRRYVQGADSQSSCLSSTLLFRQPAPNSCDGLLARTFWADLVHRDVHKPLYACINSPFAFHSLKRIQEGRPIPPATIITTSVGNITSLKESYGSLFALEDVTMQAGFYAASEEGFLRPTVPPAMIAAGMPGHAMLHAYTVFGRLQLTGEYYAYSTPFIRQYYDEVLRVMLWAGSADAESDTIKVGDMFHL
jgi:hypothetical protein